MFYEGYYCCSQSRTQLAQIQAALVDAHELRINHATKDAAAMRRCEW